MYKSADATRQSSQFYEHEIDTKFLRPRNSSLQQTRGAVCSRGGILNKPPKIISKTLYAVQVEDLATIAFSVRALNLYGSAHRARVDNFRLGNPREWPAGFALVKRDWTSIGSPNRM